MCQISPNAPSGGGSSEVLIHVYLRLYAHRHIKGFGGGQEINAKCAAWEKFSLELQ